MIELIITLAIAAVLLAIAVPSFQDIVRGNRVDVERDRLFTMLQQARNLAITTNGPVYVCRSDSVQADVDGGDISCSDDGDADWARELLLYTASPVSNGVAPNARQANQQIQTLEANAGVRQQMARTVSDAPNANINVVASRDDVVVRFNSDGSLQNAAPFVVAICDNSDTPGRDGSLITVNAVGQIRLSSTRDDDECTP